MFRITNEGRGSSHLAMGYKQFNRSLNGQELAAAPNLSIREDVCSALYGTSRDESSSG